MTARYWTPEEDIILRHYAENGYFAQQCAIRLNRPRNSILARANRLGIAFQHRSLKKPARRYG